MIEKLAIDPRFRGPPGKDGKDGVAGPPGQPGKDGRDGQSPTLDYDRITAEVMARLPNPDLQKISNAVMARIDVDAIAEKVKRQIAGKIHYEVVPSH